MRQQNSGHYMQPHALSTESPLSAGSLGRIQIQQSETNYVGPDHWAAIADRLGGDQASTSGRSLSPLPDQRHTSAELLQGPHADVTLQDIIASLPPRRIVNQLIFRYFNSLDLARLASHPPTFEAEYERFWEDPSNVSVNWLSILFSMMCLGAITSVRFDEALPPELSQVGSPMETVAHFRRRSAQCLNLAGYIKPTTYTVEALLLYFHCELSRTRNLTFEDYLILTTVIRVAMRMGYHRDPRTIIPKFPSSWANSGDEYGRF
ncbi:hypothetical protein FQN54_007039 [Arachnomyces sp. PD_36]|nr:hypothetical protein FQN54_007039 [Arachnomyces sp. PD_36]